jgi:hypothetical protein
MIVVALLAAVLVAGATDQSDGPVVEFKDCTKMSEPGHYPDYEPTPRYRIERRDYGGDTPPTLSLWISVSTEALNSGSMSRLACKLTSEFRNESKVDALIFDDRNAARRIGSGFMDQPHLGEYLWHLRAHYVLDRDKKQQFIEFLFPSVKDELLSLTRYRIRISLD